MNYAIIAGVMFAWIVVLIYAAREANGNKRNREYRER